MRRMMLIGMLVLALPLASAAATSSAGASAVADAAMKRDQAALQTLLRQKADVNAPQADGTTALHWAAHWSSLDAVELLLKAGANPNAKTRLGATPLYLAAEHGSPAMIRRLLAAGVDPNATVLAQGETPLMFAARAGSVEGVRLLLEAGAKVDVKENLRGTTALLWASEQGHAEVVSLLLRNGASPAAATKIVVPPARGRRPAPPTAAAAGAPAAGAAAAAASPAAGAAVPAPSVNPSPVPAPPAAAPAAAADVAATAPSPAVGTPATPTDRAVVAATTGTPGAPAGPQAPPDPNANARGGVTSLMLATRQASLDTVKALLEGGADINQQTADGTTALIVAMMNGDAAMGKLLLERGADVKIANKKGWNPLYLAIKARTMEKGTMPNPVVDVTGMFDVIKTMVDRGADVNFRLKEDTEIHNGIEATWLREGGATPFLRAALCGDVAVMRLLLAHGADPKLTTDDGTTTLMALSGVGYAEGFMRDFGTPAESLEAMHILLDAGIDVNAKNTDGVTALHGAAHKNFIGGIQLLVERGADLTVRSHRASPFERKGSPGNTALDWASGVQIGMQSSIYHPEAVELVTKLMVERNLPVERLLQTKGGLATVTK